MTVSYLVSSACLLAVVFSFRLNDIQIKSTYKSYHVRPEYPPPDWDYGYNSLSKQLDAGVRHFQFTVQFQNATFPVYNLRIYDENSNCGTLLDCFGDLRLWWSGTGRNTDNQVGYPLLFINIEIKETWTSEQFAQFDDLLNITWGVNALVTPDFVRGNYSTLREAITKDGWPSLNSTAGKVMITFDDSYSAYMQGNYTNLQGRLAFPSYTFNTRNDSNAAVLKLTTPDPNSLSTAVVEGFFVRAYADYNMPYYIPETQDEIDYAYFFVVDVDHGTNVTKQECVDFVTILSPDTDPGITMNYISEIFATCSANGETLALGTEWSCATSLSHICPTPSDYMSVSQATTNAKLAIENGAHIVVTSWYGPGEAAQKDGYYLKLGTSQYPVLCNPLTTDEKSCTTEAINQEYGTSPFPTEDPHDHDSQIIVITVASVVVAAVILLVLGYLIYAKYYGPEKKEDAPTPTGNYPFLKIQD